jgi:hypothetical protein
MSFIRNPLLYLLILFFDETYEGTVNSIPNPSSQEQEVSMCSLTNQIKSFEDMDYHDFMDNDEKIISWDKRPEFQTYHPSTPPCEIYASYRKSGSTPPILRYSKQSNNDIKDEHQQMSDKIL